MNTKNLRLFLTIVNHLIFLGVAGWLFGEETTIKAYQGVPQLGPITMRITRLVQYLIMIYL